jgi:predicted nucleic acid-binding protein
MRLSPPKNRLSVFIDSSVLFAAALSSHGSARDLLIAATRDDVDLFVSSFVLVETERNLARKAPRALPAFRAFRDSGLLRVIDPSQADVQHIALTIEPKDAPIVAAAISTKALYLASYDRKHLLAVADLIRSQYGILVATPDELLDAL